MPFSPLQLIVAIFVLGLLVSLIQVGALTIAFEKLGLSQNSAFLLLISSLLGSAINLPVTKVSAERPPIEQIPEPLREAYERAAERFTGQTTIAVNVGGCLIPMAFTVYLLRNNPIDLAAVLLTIALMSAICYRFSKPVLGLGIGMPVFVAPIAAALLGVWMGGEQSAPLAYICGTVGVLIGADLLRLNDIRRMGAPIASIGGAGTFDGIFITGIVAVLLA